MSLKAFHIVFLVLAALLAFGFGAWMLKWYFAAGRTIDLVMAIVSILAGAGLVWYGKVVLRKLKHISYL